MRIFRKESHYGSWRVADSYRATTLAEQSLLVMQMLEAFFSCELPGAHNPLDRRLAGVECCGYWIAFRYPHLSWGEKSGLR